MKSNTLLKIGTSAAVLGLLTNQACKEKEDKVTPIDLIIGDWKIIDIDGKNAIEEADDHFYFLSMEFMTGGSVEWCYNYQYPLNPNDNNKECYQNVTWEWLSVEDSILMLISEGDTSTVTVDYPTSDLMNWEGIEGDRVLHDNSYKLERID